MFVPVSYYVYEFSYPEGMPDLAGIVFYVGKGTNTSRMDDHFREAANGMDTAKCKAICSIWKAGLVVVRRIVFETRSEDEAFEEERRRIHLHQSPYLTNSVKYEGAKVHYERRTENNMVPLKHAVFARATMNDMSEMAMLLETYYKRIDARKQGQWVARNPDTAFVLRSEDRIVGSAFIIPLSEEKIAQILSGQVKPPTRPSEILLYEPGQHYQLYVQAVCVLQSVSREQRSKWAATFIYGLARAVINLGSRGVIVDAIYAQCDSARRERMLQLLGFYRIDVNAPTNRKNYRLDIATSGTSLAMRYKSALDNWQSQYAEEYDGD